MILGINLPSIGYPQGWQKPKPEAIRYYAGKGFKEARVAFVWNQMQPKIGGPFDAAKMQALRDTVAALRNAGFNVIFDLHDYGRYGDDPNFKLSDYLAYIAYMMKVFDFEGAVWEINEIHDLPNETAMAIVWGLISRARLQRWKMELVLPLNNWTNRAGWADDHMWQMASMIIDPANASSFQYHLYFDQWSAGQSTSIDPTWFAQLQAATASARARKLTLSSTEIGAGQDAASVAALRQAIAHMRANPDVWKRITYWDGGGWSSGPFNLDPADFWATPIADKPQLQALQP